MFTILNNSFTSFKLLPFLAISYLFINSDLLLKISLFLTVSLTFKWIYPELQSSLPLNIGGFGISGLKILLFLSFLKIFKGLMIYFIPQSFIYYYIWVFRIIGIIKFSKKKIWIFT